MICSHICDFRLIAVLALAIVSIADASAAPSMSITVKNTRLSGVPISPMILGNFVESGFGRQVTGMWAEMLFNRSFQEPKPYGSPTWQWLGIDEAHYNSAAPFWHSGYEELDWELMNPDHCRKYRTHGVETFKGDGSLVIVSDGQSATGIRQRGIYVQAGRKYSFDVFGGFGGRKVSAGLDGFDRTSKTSIETRNVTVTFREEANPDHVLAATDLPFHAASGKHPLTIDFGAFTGRAMLEITIAWKGDLILAWTSMMPADNIKGWRSDVVTLLKRVAPPVIRFPGGCFASFADWRNSVGPRSERQAITSYYWGGLEENDVGIDEFLDLCQEIGAEPQYCVNMMTGTPFKAAELVEYCNGPSRSSMGRLRTLNGVTRRKHVTYWEMDNETGRKWSAVQYAQKVVEFAREMRRVDPGIQIMMEYYSFGPEWLPAMLNIAGKDINYVIHRDGTPAFVHKALPVLREYNLKHGTSLKLVDTEWLPDTTSPGPLSDPGVPVHYGWSGQMTNVSKQNLAYRQSSWFYALNAADRLADYLSYGGEFHLANFNNCVNTWGQNVIEASKEGAWLSPAGRVFAFLGSGFKAAYPLETSLAGGSGALVKAIACEESGRKGIVVYVINHNTEAVDLSLNLPDGFSADSAETIFAPDRLSRNTLEKDAVQGVSLDAPPNGVWSIKPLSFTKIHALGITR